MEHLCQGSGREAAEGGGGRSADWRWRLDPQLKSLRRMFHTAARAASVEDAGRIKPPKTNLANLRAEGAFTVYEEQSPRPVHTAVPSSCSSDRYSPVFPQC
jgi:hypothetical protein